MTYGGGKIDDAGVDHHGGRGSRTLAATAPSVAAGDIQAGRSPRSQGSISRRRPDAGQLESRPGAALGGLYKISSNRVRPTSVLRLVLLSSSFAVWSLLSSAERPPCPPAALAMLVGFCCGATIATRCFPGCRICVVKAGLAPWDWLPYLLLLALIDGLLAQSKGVPWRGGWRLRLGVGLLAALLIVPAKLPDEWPIRVQEKAWSVAAFTLIVALGWGGSAEGGAGSRPAEPWASGCRWRCSVPRSLCGHAHYGKAAPRR